MADSTVEGFSASSPSHQLSLGERGEPGDPTKPSSLTQISEDCGEIRDSIPNPDSPPEAPWTECVRVCVGGEEGVTAALCPSTCPCPPPPLTGQLFSSCCHLPPTNSWHSKQSREGGEGAPHSPRTPEGPRPTAGAHPLSEAFQEEAICSAPWREVGSPLLPTL